MDARDDQVERRLSGLREEIRYAAGPVDVDASWEDLKRRRRAGPRRTRQAGRWVAAAAVLAAILVAAPYALRYATPPQATLKPARGGPGIPIGNALKVDFLTPQEGFAAVSLGGYGSRNALLFTKDSGKTWAVRKLPKGDTVLAMHFSSALQGALLVHETGLGQSGAAGEIAPVAILTTNDGGESWQEVYSEHPTRVGGDMGFRFFGAAGYAFDGDKILYTSDRASWSALTLPKGFSPSGMAFPSATSGFVAGEECVAPTGPNAAGQGQNCRAALIATTDGGKSWSTSLRTQLLGGPTGSEVSFANAQDGWFYHWDLATFQGTLYRTTDGGQHWSVEQSNFASGRVGAGALTFISAKVGWVPLNPGAAAVSGGLLVTRDGGETWTTIGADRHWMLHSASLLTPEIGYIAGQNQLTLQGFLLKTEDGGRTWTQVLPSLSPSSAMDFIGAKHGFGLGTPSDPSAVLATSDGGATWSEVGRLPANPMGISFVSAQVGYAVAAPKSAGTSMQVLKTSDGGHNWRLQGKLSATPGSMEFFSSTPYMEFFDARSGILETEDDLQRTVLEKTSNGGRTWTPAASFKKTTSKGWHQFAFSFVSPADGYLLSTTSSKTVVGSGSSGVKYRAGVSLEETTDGGGTWRTVKRWSAEEGEHIYFASPQVGWVILRSASPKAKATMLQTTDGGRSWSQVPLPKGFTPSFLDFLTAQTGVAHGQQCSAQGDACRPVQTVTNDGGRTWSKAP